MMLGQRPEFLDQLTGIALYCSNSKPLYIALFG